MPVPKIQSTRDRKIAAMTTMIATMTEVIQVYLRVVQVILRASERTSRKNWAMLTRFLGAAGVVASGEAGAIAAAVLAARFLIAVGVEPGFLAIEGLETLYNEGGDPPSGSNIGAYWQEWRDSNPRPSVLETDALPAELHSYDLPLAGLASSQ